MRDILGEQPITCIPLAPPEIAGSLNLRGRIVTAIDLRRRLRLPPAPAGQKRMSVVADQGGELYALLVDQVSEVLSLDAVDVRTEPADPGEAAGRPSARGSIAWKGGCWSSSTSPGCLPCPVRHRSMSRTCLVVDDSRVVRKVARRILEANDFTVNEAADGQLAMDACRLTMPDCILLDWNMPVMDGITFLRNLRSEFGPDKPLVVFCRPKMTSTTSRRRSRAAPRNTS